MEPIEWYAIKMVVVKQTLATNSIRGRIGGVKIGTYYWNRTRQEWTPNLIQTCLYSSLNKAKNDFKHKKHNDGPTRKHALCKIKLNLSAVSDDPDKDWP